MLASIPASILNHIRRRTGIPPDSIKPGNALAFLPQTIDADARSNEKAVADLTAA